MLKQSNLALELAFLRSGDLQSFIQELKDGS